VDFSGSVLVWAPEPLQPPQGSPVPTLSSPPILHLWALPFLKPETISIAFNLGLLRNTDV
jgi:hypothetical protein